MSDVVVSAITAYWFCSHRLQAVLAPFSYLLMVC